MKFVHSILSFIQMLGYCLKKIALVFFRIPLYLSLEKNKCETIVCFRPFLAFFFGQKIHWPKCFSVEKGFDRKTFWPRNFQTKMLLVSSKFLWDPSFLSKYAVVELILSSSCGSKWSTMVLYQGWLRKVIFNKIPNSRWDHVSYKSRK